MKKRLNGGREQYGGDNPPWPAPAKLNLTLRVLGRRPDGYHELQTVFQFIELEDLLSFQLRSNGAIRRLSDLPGVPAEEDLAVRAAQLLQAYTRCSLGADIWVDKGVPLGGGLGGGSSDAATTLVALNQLWKTGLDLPTLAALGLRLGADVPVFVCGRAAWGEGVGEMLKPLELTEPWYLVLVPPCKVATAAVFGAEDLTRDSPRITIADFLAGEAVNDCLSVVRRRYPPVAQALDWLGHYTQAFLTGTGGCVFASFEQESPARELLQAVPPSMRAFVTRGCNLSPLMRRVGV